MSTLLVTGASGQVGQRVLELLLEKGETSIIATTRNPDKLAHFKAQGVDVRFGDFDDPATLVEAFTGADRVLIISTDELGVPGKRLTQHTNAVKAADEAGVKHVIYTSIAKAAGNPILFAPDHSGTEDAMEASSMGYTSLRNNIYMENLLNSIPQAYASGAYYTTTGDHKMAYICREDCAKAATAALADSFEGRRILEISGAEAYSTREIAKVAEDLTGKSLNVVDIDHETAVNGMVSAGLPRPVAETYASIDTAINQDKMNEVTDAFKALTGDAPMTLPEFLKAHQDALVQSPA